MEQEDDLLSKKIVPLGQTKLKRRANDEAQSGATTSKSVCTRDEFGTWRRALPVFDSSVKRNKVELRCDERMLDVDGLFRVDDDQSDRRTDTEIMQQQMLKFARSMAKGEKHYANYKPTQGDTEDKELMKGRSSVLKIASEIEMQKKADTDKSEKKLTEKSSRKLRHFDGMTLVEAFLQQFRVCAHYYK